MKKFYLFALLMSFCSFGLVGCDDDDEVVAPLPEVEAPIIKLDPARIDATAEGGEFSLNVTVENPIEGAELKVENTAEWIEVVAAEGKISVKVAENTAVAREAELKVAYPEAETVSVAVKQAEGKPAAFQVEVKSVSEIGAMVNVVAQDKQMRYIMQTFYTDLVNRFPEDAQLVANDKRYFETMAEDYMLPFDELMESNSQVGDQELPVEGLVPGRKYTTYVYGVSLPDFTQLTEVTRVEFETVAVEKKDIRFEITATAESINIDLNIKPVNYDGKYSYDIVEMPATMTDEEVRTRLEEDWYQTIALYLMFGETPETITNSFCMTGECVWAAEKDAKRDYVAYAYGVDEKTAFINSEVQFVRVKTGDVAPSDNIITIDVSDITAYTAHVSFTPSNDDPYAMIALSDEQIAGIEGDDLLNALSRMVDFWVNGVFESEMSGLLPSTEYHVFAFGYKSGTAITALFEKVFTTAAPEVSPAKAELNYGKYYDALRVGELDIDYDNQAADGTVFIPVDFVYDEGTTLYSAFFTEKEANSLTDDQIITNLIDRFGPTDVRVPYAILRAPYGMSIVGVAFGIDAEGRYTKVYRGQTLTATPEGVGDPKELVANYPWPKPEEEAISAAAPKRQIVKAEANFDAFRAAAVMEKARSAKKAALKAQGAKAILPRVKMVR